MLSQKNRPSMAITFLKELLEDIAAEFQKNLDFTLFRNKSPSLEQKVKDNSKHPVRDPRSPLEELPKARVHLPLNPPHGRNLKRCYL